MEKHLKSPTTTHQHNPIHKRVRQGARDKKKTTKHNPKHQLQALRRWEFRFISTWVTVCFHTAMLPWSPPAPLDARHQPSMRRCEQPQHPLVAAPVFPKAIFYFFFFCPNEDFFSIHAVHCFPVTKPSGGFSTFYLGSVFRVAKKKAPWLLPKTKFLEKWETNRGGQSAHLHLTKYFSACS